MILVRFAISMFALTLLGVAISYSSSSAHTEQVAPPAFTETAPSAG
jgi:hypothetical protein